MTPKIFQLEVGPQIGSGGCGLVYQARDIDTGRLVALKKSRASIILKRTVLHYEARMLKCLAGHPSIPAVFAHGRFAHFEYLAMELLGRDLEDMVEDTGSLALEFVLNIADQTLSALEHIHKYGIVHRDIKPANIILSQNHHSEVRLIDFGLSRHFLAGTPQIREPSIAHNHVVGTLLYASLNAHQGVDLNPRDDLESLSYTLIFLLKGSLPWQTYSERGTTLGRYAQVREKKRTWTGSMFAKYCPREFGQLLNYARELMFTENIDYSRLRAQFASVRQTCTVPPKSKGQILASWRNSVLISSLSGCPGWPLASTQSQLHSCPVEVGQIVSIQIMARTSIEGYSLQGLTDLWHDPLLSSREFSTAARPAIIVDTSFDQTISLFKILVVSVGRDNPVQTVTPAKGVSGHIALSTYHLQRPGTGAMVVLEPAWPILNTYCYAFPRASWFYCLPNQTPTPAHWKVNCEDLEVLRRRFAKPFPMSFPTARIADPALRYETRMFLQDIKIFVDVVTLSPLNINSKALDWRGDRGFFDELALIARRRGLEDGFVQWTGVLIEHEDNMTDSYDGDDHSVWDAYTVQRERKRELTLNQSHEGLFDEDGKLGLIVKVI